GRFGPEVARQLGSPQAKGQLRQLIQALAQSVAQDPVAAAYQQAVDGIALYDPILAYRLRGLGRFADLDAQTTQYFERLMARPEVAADPEAQVLLSSLETQTLEAAYSDALKNLSTQIRLIAL